MRPYKSLLLIALVLFTGLPYASQAAQDPAPKPQQTDKPDEKPPEKKEEPKDEKKDEKKEEKPGPVLRFAAVGDTGTGDKYQLAVASQMIAEYERNPFKLVLMLGDNTYRSGSFEKQIQAVFEVPYAKLIEKGVDFYATLGNHDQVTAKDQTNYSKFHMGGKTYYSFKPEHDLVEFFTFDSTLVVGRGDDKQLEWLEGALKESKARWKIVYCHHPPFSPGKRHGDNPILEERLVPMLEKYGVRIVMTGHEHFFAKLREENGVDYIISGSGGKIHNGGIQPDPRLEAGNDVIHQFLSITLTEDLFSYTVIGEEGQTIHQGTIPYATKTAPAEKKAAAP